VRRSRTTVVALAAAGLLAAAGGCGDALESAAPVATADEAGGTRADAGAGAGADSGADAAAVADGGAAPGKRRGKGGKGAARGALEAEAADVIPPELHAGDGTARMVARLAELARRADPEQDWYMNVERVPIFEQRVAAAQREGKPGFQQRLLLAAEKLGAGRAEEAAADLVAVLAELDTRGARVNPEFRLQALGLLATAWMRVGEQGNCIEHHGTDSCLLPISEAGRHADGTGSRQALEVLAELLRATPEDHAARWLYNIAAMTLGEWPQNVPAAWLVPPSAFESAQDVGRFRDVAAACGWTARGLAGGVCVEDLDGDGLLDLLTSEWTLDGPLRYARNDGQGRFTDRSAEAGLAGLYGGLNLLHGDVDNDGDADVLVLRGVWKAEFGARHPFSLLANDGTGSFRDVTEEAGLLCFLSTQTAAFADYDGDGWLDLFVGNESVGTHRSPCRLFHNDGDGTFTEVGAALGVDAVAYVKGCGWGDYDDDGDPDLVLSRMDGPKLLYRNDGARFTEVAAQAGLTGPAQSFPCWWFDYDNDGHLDLFFSGYRFGQTDDVCRDYLGKPHQGVTPRLYRNRGDGRFEDTTAAAGLMHVLPTMGCNIGDLDNDGWTDFYLATGEPDLRGIYPNRLFRNDGGARFVDVTSAAGVGHLQKGHGVAFGDLDNDGDQDLVAVMGGAYAGDVFQRALFENPGHGARWVTLLLQGTRANRSAIGARLRVQLRRADGSTRDIHHVIGTGGSFGSGSLQAELGLGDATAIEAVEVRWPGSPGRQLFRDLAMDRCWRLVEGEDAPRPEERRPVRLGGG
jgi:hypothetical protein